MSVQPTTTAKSMEASSTPPPKTRRTLAQFLRKYFLQGQHLDPSLTKISEERQGQLPFHERYRKYIGFLMPIAFMHLVWWTLAIRYNIFRLYPTRYALAVTMLFGSFVAGATSEGGGSVAFPVMTLLLHINPVVARDFTLMIQSCGMTSAAFTIMWMRVVVEWRAVVFCTVGSTLGIVSGLQFVDRVFDGPSKKMLFVSIWFSFSVALYLLNREHKRIAHLQIQNFTAWKAAVLVATGFVGGHFSSFAGTGVCICAFSILTLLFRVSEKVATPTSVLLMAANTLVGFFWRELIQRGISEAAWEYFQVAVPTATISGPLGAFTSSHVHRQVFAALIYLIEVLAVIGFLVTSPPLRLILIGLGIIAFGFCFFSTITRLGKWLDAKEERLRNLQNKEEAAA